MKRDRQPKLRRFATGDEPGIVSVLAQCKDDTWGARGVPDWEWRHTQRPGFVPEDVVVAEADGQIIGCFHGAVLPIKIDDGLTVPMSYDGDYSVLPDHRGGNITRQAYDLTDNELTARGVALRGGFTTRELNQRFYHKRFGYVFVRTTTTVQSKILSLEPLEQPVRELGARLLARSRVRRALSTERRVIDLNVEGLPACHLTLSGDGIELAGGTAAKPALLVRVPYVVVASIADGFGPTLRALAFASLRGRVRVRGLLEFIPSLARAAGAALRG